MSINSMSINGTMFNGKGSERILHMFGWKFVAITDHLDKVAEQGFTAIQVGPVQGTKFTEETAPWWGCYQPTNLQIGNAQIGSKAEFTAMCSKAHQLGLKVVVDIVLRHVASDDRDTSKPHHSVDKQLLQYIKPVGECYDYKNREAYTTMRTGMPMLDYDNPQLQQLYRQFLHELTDCGADGFRLDQLKHYKLPEEGSNFLHIFDDFQDKIVYGEVIFEGQWLLDRYAAYMHVLTEGRPSNCDRLVSFFESHDTYYEFGYTKRMDDRMRLTEWNVLVNQCKYHALYFCRPFETLWMSEDMKRINHSR